MPIVRGFLDDTPFTARESVDAPDIPVTWDEQVKSAVDCDNAGARALHFRMRNPMTGHFEKRLIREDAMKTTEHTRLDEARERTVDWKKWGPYLSERQWGTVREDYSENGDAWNFFTHDQARSRAYRWGEDGLAGISDDKQRLCFALALWNGKDPILKERLFGLTNGEGNHGEDVKEYYFYVDSTPTHS